MVKRKKNHLWSRGPGIEWKEEAVPGYAPAAVGSAKIGARVGEKVEHPNTFASSQVTPRSPVPRVLFSWNLTAPDG